LFFFLIVEPYYRSALSVKALMRGFGLLLLSAMIVGLSGCGTDNESDAAKAGSTGTPPPAGAGPATPGPPMRSMDDYAKSKSGYTPYAGTKLDPSKKPDTSKKN
jgi:hypothetical protein